MSSPIPAVYRGAQEAVSRVVNLFAYFSDQDDTDAQLAYTVVQNTNPALVTSTPINATTGDMSLNFAFDTGGVANLTVRATDRTGAFVEQTFSVYVVRVNGLSVEWQKPDGAWRVEPENEVLWVQDVLQWTADFSPSSPPFINGIEWVAKPWENRDDASVPWQTFASTLGIGSAIGSPGEGDWAITPRVLFGGAFAMLAAPAEKIVTDFTIKWRGYEDYADGEDNFFDGDKFFAEQNAPTIPLADDELHDKIDVEITPNIAIPEGKMLTVHLKSFDPDHASSDLGWDTNGNAPNDNLPFLGPEVEGGGGVLLDDMVTLGAGDLSKSVTFVVEESRPGNNFLVAAFKHAESRDAAVFGADGKTLLSKPAGEPIAGAYRTTILTIWRTLHVERDSMGAPIRPVLGVGGETFDGPGEEGDDDVDPGNVPDPSIELMVTNYLDAFVRVVADLFAYDVRDDADFVRNMASVPGDPVAYLAARSVRDVHSEAGFWVVQVFGAYEGPEDRSNDPNGEGAKLYGVTPGPGAGPDRSVVIFLETHRDVAVDRGDEAMLDLAIQRGVLHESLHHFGLNHADPLPPGPRPPGDDGPLNVANKWTAGAAGVTANRLTPAQCLAIQKTIAPH